MSSIKPILYPVRISELRPTQMTVGFREIEMKRKAWRKKSDKQADDFLGRHMIPALKGPAERFYVLDHHHLIRALQIEGIKEVVVNVLADLSHLDKAAFWTVCEHRAWVHPYGADGVRQAAKHIPKYVADLEDDPYRSLSGELRRVGGFAKDTTPFSEFLWADFLRRRVSQECIVKDFDMALAQAVKLARSHEASYLPGWSGPADD